MGRTQSFRDMAVGTPLGDDVLLLRSMSATEQMSRPFKYDLELLSEDAAIHAEDLIGQNVTVRLETRAEPRFFNGFVSRFVQLDGVDALARYRATLVPWLWFLTRTADCRIFQNMTVPDIVKQVFRDHELTDFEDRLAGTYRTWVNCVQYRETDFNFVSRLMEQEGISYFFTHENGLHKLVLCDAPDAHESYPGYDEISYRSPGEIRLGQEHLTELTVVKEFQSGAYALNDYDFEAPRKDLRTRQSLTPEPDHALSDFEVYDYPGEYTEYDDGQQYARTRIEQLQAHHELVHGHANARGVAVGHAFNLTYYPRDDQNRAYLVTAASYQLESDAFGSGGDSTGPAYVCRFTAMPAAKQFRPARTTPKPVVQGCQTAVVVGSSGEEIHTDEYGRVKVQFHWDRYGEANENSSCWIRVAQVWAGRSWGAMHIPRIGQEVIVEFLEGDPDQPIITGRVYNDIQKVPYDLPGEKTKSTIKSNSSKGGGGFNEIRIEDKKGEEQIFVHAEKNQDIRVKADTYEWIGNDRHLVVKKDQFEHVENNRHEKVDADHKEEIGKDRHLKVKGKEAKGVDGSCSLTVGGDVVEKFGANHKEEVTQTLAIKALSAKIEASTGIELKCGGSSIVLTPAAIFIMGGPLVNINSGSGPPVGPVTAQAVSPAAPDKAEDADQADPGEVAEIKAEQIQKQSGKYGSVPVKPFKPPSAEEVTEEMHWIEIELVDEEDKPIAGVEYEIKMPDGETVASGTLDEKGQARVDGIKDPGNCQITFPKLDRDAWERI